MHHRLTANSALITHSDQSPWLRSSLPAEVGACTTNFLTFTDGLSVAYADYRPQYDLLETSVIEREPSLTVAIALEGHSYTVGGNGQRFDFMAGHSTVAAYASTRGERCFPANQVIRQLRLIVPAPLLRQYGMASVLDECHRGHPPRPLFHGQHGLATHSLTAALIHRHDQASNLLDLHVAALSLLAERLRPILVQPTKVGKLTCADQDTLWRVRDIMMAQFDRPLSIGYLCASVGTNEFKLKQGFRELFGTSPYRMLTDIRMEKAWALLETGLQVSTVAYKVGFQHLSSFSTAFERYYGRTPKSVAGGRSQIKPSA